MDRFAALQGFVAACDHGSFSAAGRALRLSPTMVAKYVDSVEARLGVRLLHRTTRRLVLTEEGQAFRELAVTLLADFEAAERTVGADKGRPYGTLRLNAPLTYGVRRVAPLVAEFLRLHPDVKVEAAYGDRVVDLSEEGWDLALRIAATLPDSSSLIARPITNERLVLCAAPDYLRRRGTPTHPKELSAHACLTYTLARGTHADQWSFVGERRRTRSTIDLSVPVSGPLSADNGDALRIAALAGHGFIMQPHFVVANDLETGCLVEVQFEDLRPGQLSVFAVYPRGRYPSAKVKAFVELAQARLNRTECLS